MATPSPKTLAARIKKELRALGKPAVAESMRRFFKSGEHVRFLGVKTPELRLVARSVYNDVKKVWALEDALALGDMLLRDAHIEARSCGLAVLARFTAIPRTAVRYALEHFPEPERKRLLARTRG